MTEYGDAPASTYKKDSVTAFRTAAADYAKFADRAYIDAQKAGKKSSDFVPENLLTYAQRALVLSLDTTGSMGETPGTIFGKYPFLAAGALEYLGRDAVVSFTSIGDARNKPNEKYPVQITPFESFVNGEELLRKRIKQLVPEKMGGGGASESYELTALYVARKIATPNDKRPIYIITGDEQPYPYVEVDQAEEFTFINLSQRISTEEVFNELQKKFSTYLIRKRYQDMMMDSVIDTNWKRLLGTKRIAYLLDDTRVVDIIFGILAKETGRVDEFWKELIERQTPDQVNLVEQCLEPVIGLRPNKKTERSTQSSPLA